MKKKLVTVLAIITAAVLISGCQGNRETADSPAAAKTQVQETADTANTDASQPAEVKKILVGNSGAPKPYSFTTDDDELTGYEIEVLKAIDELLPEYQFELEKTEFASIFLGIDSGRYQIGVNNITRKPEREEKYLFADEAHVYNYTVAIVKKGRDDIQTLEDLGGKTVYTSGSGGFSDLFAEDFNEGHPDNPIELVFSSADTVKIYQDIADGVVDFSFAETVMFNSYAEEFPELMEQLEYVQFSLEETEQIQDPYGWFIYPQTEEGEILKAAVDEAIRTLAKDGTLLELSNRFFGFDATGR